MTSIHGVCFAGTDGGLDFGCLRVHEELRLTMQVKNRGRYDIAYK